MDKVIISIFMFGLIIISFCELLVGAEISNPILRQEYEIKQEEINNLDSVRVFKNNINACMEKYENTWSGPTITTLDDCLAVDECVECVDDCITNSRLDSNKAFGIARSVRNNCFIRGL